MDTSTNARPWAIRHQGVERVQPLPMAGLEESDTSAENVVPDWRGSLGAWNNRQSAWPAPRKHPRFEVELHAAVCMVMARRPQRAVIQAGVRAVSRFLARALPGQLAKAMAATSRRSLALAPDAACMEMPEAMVAR